MNKTKKYNKNDFKCFLYNDQNVHPVFFLQPILTVFCQLKLKLANTKRRKLPILSVGVFTYPSIIIDGDIGYAPGELNISLKTIFK